MTKFFCRSQMLHQTTSPLIEFWILPVAILCILLHVYYFSFHALEMLFRWTCGSTKLRHLFLRRSWTKCFPNLSSKNCQSIVCYDVIEYHLYASGHDSLSIHILSVNALYAISKVVDDCHSRLCVFQLFLASSFLCSFVGVMYWKH